MPEMPQFLQALASFIIAVGVAALLIRIGGMFEK
jgi:hypothetical protein